MVESDTAQVSVLPMVESDTARVSVLPGCGRSGRWPAVSPIGFGGNPAGFDGRASRDELYSSGRNPGRWTFGGDTSSGAVRPFRSRNVHDKHMEEALEHSVLEKPLDGGSLEGRSVVD